MKKLAIYLFTFLFVQSLISQNDTKFGNITTKELEMSQYELDSEAQAVVLYESLQTNYDFNTMGLFVINNYHVRIKILNNEGLDYANQSVLLYKGKTRSDSDDFSGFSGFTYNLENGKIEKIKLSKEHIFEEKVSDYWLRTKFTFQTVKPGSVIEYRYTTRSPRYTYLPDVVFQRSIPVKYSKYELLIPEYFVFRKETKGFGLIKTKSGSENQTFMNGGNRLSFTSEKLEFEAQDLPALKNEDYVWNIKDYLARVTFELEKIVIPGVLYKDFSNTWQRVDEELLSYSNFGKQFNHKLFKNDFASILTPEMNGISKVKAIYNMVKSKVNWNEKSTLWANDPKDALKKGVGTSGEINALLISALREAGFDAYPVVMSQRDKGRIPMSHPTIESLNYFVVAAVVDDKTLYMDAAAKFGDINVLPLNCMSNFSRSVREKGLSDWVDLTMINDTNRKITNYVVEFNSDGVLSGKVSEVMLGEVRYMLRTDYSECKDEKEFIEKKETKGGIQISDFEVRGMNNEDDRSSLSYNFTKNDVKIGDDHLYFNPLLIPMFSENQFKAEKRELPVEFPFSADYRINVTIKIPEGYILEEFPESKRLTLNDNDAAFIYMVEKKEDGSLVIGLRYSLRKIIYIQNEYDHLRDFFTLLVDANNAQIVLKKVKE